MTLRTESCQYYAKQLDETSLMFLVHPTLTQAEIAKTAQVMKEVFGLATK
jgi:dTDP-4-amino-4,6-dideoxygalactose transaminase